jgi:UDP-N-acetylmuramate dehydrogenase
MQIQQNISLKPFNTFGIDSRAAFFAAFSSVEALDALINHNPASERLILGGGSNLLFTGNYNGLVLKNEISGIEQVNEDDEFVYLKAGAGENWHRFVQYCIKAQLGGVENLALIPGNIGAGPMQNIGAYGVEMKDVFHELEAWHLDEHTLVKFGLHDCAFGYRESVFKQKFRGQFAILTVTCRLRKKPQYNIGYGAIADELTRAGVQELSPAAVADAVIRIRQSKLPDPAMVGNAGSFFKNPQVSVAKFNALQQAHPGIVGYPQRDDTVKLAAGWLIEQCGWKGYRKGDAGCHAKQALVLVNYGHANGNDIYALSEAILQSVQASFGVLLEREVNIAGAVD